MMYLYATYNVGSYLSIFTIMDKRTHTIPKENASGSLALNHSLLDGQSNWSRCNSFSSSSNDSSLFSSSHLQSSPIALGKRMAAETSSAVLPKRSRNSSGSSVSSNMSCVSDKDAKKTVIISSRVPQVSAHQSGIRTVEDLSRLSCPDINSTAFGLNHEHLLNQHLACAESAESMLPFRHNLRRNIRKKTCSCDCTATCTTLVVRRYNKIGKKTVKEETLISTKVETCSPTKSSQEVHNVSYEKEFSPSKADNNRRRRSEVEKLYDSLHEIEWAKNFSPDNILRHINIRQNASVSMFGSTPKPDQTSPESKANKKPKTSTSEQSSKSKLVERQEEDNKLESNNIVHRTRSKTQNLEQQSPPSNNKTPVNHKQKSVQKKAKLRTNCSQFSECESNSKPDISGSSSCINSLTPKKERKSSSTDSSESPQSENSLVCFKTEPEEIHDLTTDIKFFDIAEESIRTIDACFGEVGAEVVISTCYEVDSDLPQLTSVKDGSASLKQSSPFDIPPVLECCVSVSGEKCIPASECNNFSENANESVSEEKYFAPNSDVNTYPSLSNETMSEEKSSESDSAVNTNLTVSFESVSEVESCAQESDVNTNQTLSKESESEEESCSQDSDVNTNLTFSKESLSDKESCAQEGNANRNLFVINASTSEEKSYVQESNDKLTNLSLKITDMMNPPIKQSHLNNKNANKKLLIRAGRRILNRYLKYLQPKREPVRGTIDKVKRKPETSQQDLAPPTLNSRNSFSESSLKQAKMKNTNSLISVRPSYTYSSHALSCQTVESNPISRTVVKTEQKVSYSSSNSGVSFSHSKSDSLYASKETVSSFSSAQNGKRTFIMKESSSSFSIHEPGPSTLLSIRHKSEDDRDRKHIPRPQNSSFTCHYQSLRVYRYNGYSQVVLKLTRRNSIFLSVESLAELRDVMKKISQDPHCHTFILMGCGQSFCSGLDLLPLLGPHKNSASGEMAVAVKEFIEVLSAFKKPVVVVVDGPAIGLGVTILTHADISIASEMATFCMPQNSLGFFPEGGATLTLPKAVGSTVAMDLILRGRSLTATEAKQVGLISEVVSVKDLGLDLVSRIKRLAENSLTSMETTKAMLKMRLQLELALVLESEVKLLPQMWLSESCQEALQRALRSGVWIT